MQDNINLFTLLHNYISCEKTDWGLVKTPSLIGGTMPECIWQMTNLTGLFLSNNGFHGTIPYNAFNDLKKLEDVDISRNRFFGEINPSVFDLPLKSFDISHNKISGSL